MSDHLTRKELKQDNVALKVEETAHFLGVHRQQLIRYGGGILAIIAIVAIGFYYRSAKAEERQRVLGEAIAAQNAPIGAAPSPGALAFPTEQAKKDAITKAYNRLTTEYSGSEEAYVAEYGLGTMDLEAGKNADARRRLQDVADHAAANYASLAKLSLAQLDFSEGKASEAQAILKDLIDHPTDLVSSDQATIILARNLGPSNPAEAKKLLNPLAAKGSDTGQIAVGLLNELPR